jgi:uncharacterized protein (DUF983 family)
MTMERECERPECGYALASMTAGNPQVARGLPNECPVCGGGLVVAGGGEADE